MKLAAFSLALILPTAALAAEPADLVASFLVGATDGATISIEYINVDLARSVAESDHVFDREGVRVLVAQDTIAFVEGTEIDYQRQGINAAFVFRNPNATGECGCGESFTVDARA